MSKLELSRGERLDTCVARQLPPISRSFAAKLISEGKVKVNGEIVTKAGYKLKDNDRVTIGYSLESLTQIPTITLPIIYEDDDCVVINKPIGLLTHSKGAFNPEPTVASWLHGRLPHLKGDRAGIVHRLDRATSGVMICAKNEQALSWLQKKFAQRAVKKTYLAIVSGHIIPEAAIIDMPIERNPKRPQTFRVGQQGKAASTTYKLLATNETYSLVELRPTTGRTHQLRVHLSHLHHPILGDTFYGGATADRLYLHARQLEITLPNHERRIFTAPLPRGFKAPLKKG